MFQIVVARVRSVSLRLGEGIIVEAPIPDEDSIGKFYQNFDQVGTEF